MRILVWQWGRRGAGPRFAVSLAEGLRSLPGVEATLSLSTGAEIMQAANPPACDLPVPTYRGYPGLLLRMAQAPLTVPQLAKRIAALRPDVAVCAMPGPIDGLMAAALRRLRIPFAVIVHDAAAHPGERMPLRIRLQDRLVRGCDLAVTLSTHVADVLRERHVAGGRDPLVLSHPPFAFSIEMTPPGAHRGPVRLLFFGRLLRYKGLDLLAEAIGVLSTPRPWRLRVVGQGPESADLAALRARQGVSVENRWVPEEEVGRLIAWSDIVVLPYREASQSGVAPAAIAAGRLVVGTRVGGLAEQLQGEKLATLCAPEAKALAEALAQAIAAADGTARAVTPVDARAAWRDMAADLVDGLRPILRHEARV